MKVLRTQEEIEKVRGLFRGWDDVLYRACLEGTGGEVVAAGKEIMTAGGDPAAAGRAYRSACLHFADFYLFAGEPDGELLKIPEGDFSVLTPADEKWEAFLAERLPAEEKSLRFCIRKDTVFDRKKLEAFASALPEGVELKRIDASLYGKCLENDWSQDFVKNFRSKEDFLTRGVGILAVKDGEILAGCSSYARCTDAVEVEVDTRKDQRRKHLALACAAGFILTCLDLGLYPGWDAMNRESLRLSEKLGYVLSHTYTVYNHSGAVCRAEEKAVST